MVTAALRSVFAQETTEEIASRWDDLATSLADRFPKAATLMNEAREDVLAFRHFPQPHWKKVWSTNLLERVNVAPRGALCKLPHQAPDSRRRHLPQRPRHHAPGGSGAAGATGALAAGGPPHVLRREHGRHPGSGRHTHSASPQRLRETELRLPQATPAHNASAI